MNELQRALISDSAAASPGAILEGLTSQLALQNFAGAPRTIYQELWHIVFWQQLALDWIGGVETPYPVHATAGFPNDDDITREPWDRVCEPFFSGIHQAAQAAGDEERLNRMVRCPTRPGEPTREMTSREQLESLSAHNAYHFGRIVLLRQLHGAWPPGPGGFSW